MAEEANGEVLDSWEEFEDNGDLDKKLEEMKLKDSKKTASEAVVVEDGNRTQYTPQVRILKRKSDAHSTAAHGTRANNKPTKTLEQREAEYAEARKRILGSTSSTEVKEETIITNNRPPRLMQLDEARQNLNNNCSVAILRQPRGPDGTDGFDQKG
ncbi:SUZ RNA-binding domain-containing isoform X1 [Magallana gigas]|uniref:SUZ RNA-binding domain-containing isoform X1 n=1 Tax=Magallana gigas TaxID=29159 RepID=UPI0005C3CA11|nr:SUZ domain-containing protein 1 isoform X1 [Crassostrea gigas]|eukprot:XP_011422610.1 PREDICTED: SUZ domain-containing protein 1 [Crassostrea gigas]